MPDIDIESMRRRIVAQADALGDDGWMDIAVPTEFSPDGKLRVPRGAFERWAVARAGGEHLAAPWSAVSPRGLKQKGDDAYHTDWMLGAGLDLHDMRSIGGNPHWESLKDSAYAAMLDVERRLLDFRCSVLLAGPAVRGRVFHPADMSEALPHDPEGNPFVMVVRNAEPGWLALAAAVLRGGGAVVVERGGEMAHMVAVLRSESGGPIVRVPDARKLYPEGTTVLVSPSEGKVSLIDDGRVPSAEGRVPTADAPTVSAGTYDGDPATWPLREVSAWEDRVFWGATYVDDAEDDPDFDPPKP